MEEAEALVVEHKCDNLGHRHTLPFGPCALPDRCARLLTQTGEHSICARARVHCKLRLANRCVQCYVCSGQSILVDVEAGSPPPRSNIGNSTSTADFAQVWSQADIKSRLGNPTGSASSVVAQSV